MYSINCFYKNYYFYYYTDYEYQPYPRKINERKFTSSFVLGVFSLRKGTSAELLLYCIQFFRTYSVFEPIFNFVLNVFDSGHNII